MQKTDCYWYAEEHDMNARIPYCKLDPTNPYDQVIKCNLCKNYHSKWRPTNADKVREMNDKELNDWFWWMLNYTQGYTDSRIALREWLKKEVDK